jgi:hypothetical protein
LDACKKGNLKRVKKLVKLDTVSCQDTHGRNSSPLHLAGMFSLTKKFLKISILFYLMSIAGYNNIEIAEYLLENNANAALQDRGGLIPLHNAASYGVSRFLPIRKVLVFGILSFLCYTTGTRVIFLPNLKKKILFQNCIKFIKNYFLTVFYDFKKKKKKF